MMNAEEAATTYSKQSDGFHPNGQQRSELKIKADLRHGLDISWNEPGLKDMEGLYPHNQREGLWVYWHSNGKIREQGPYPNGEDHGTFVS